jgi:hypothetical protein
VDYRWIDMHWLQVMDWIWAESIVYFGRAESIVAFQILWFKNLPLSAIFNFVMCEVRPAVLWVSHGSGLLAWILIFAAVAKVVSWSSISERS